MHHDPQGGGGSGWAPGGPSLSLRKMGVGTSFAAGYGDRAAYFAGWGD